MNSGANDVEAVMDAVADELRQWERSGGRALSLTLTQDQGQRLTERARKLRYQWNIDASAVIHSTRPGWGPWVIRFQSIVRRLTWWFLEPILQQVRLFQANAAQVMETLAENQEGLTAQLGASAQADWTERIEALEAQVKALQRQVGKHKGGDAG